MLSLSSNWLRASSGKKGVTVSDGVVVEIAILSVGFFVVVDGMVMAGW